MIFMECTSVFDSEGKFSPKFHDKNLKEFEFDQIIMAVGQTVESSLAKYLEQELEKGLIDVDLETQLVRGKKNIYAGGDIVRGAGTVVQSVADGRNAARAIHQNLVKK